jgi:beta-ketoacyl synthase-like protein
LTHAVRVLGAGVVCALGVGGQSVVEALKRDAPGFRGPSASRAAYPAPFDPLRDLPRGAGRRLGRQLAMALYASLDAVGARRAWDEDPAETGIFAATAHGPIDETVDFVDGASANGPRYASPVAFSGSQHNAMVGVTARELGVRGPAMVLCNGEVSFETALYVAQVNLASGRMRRALVVGADAWHPLYMQSLAAFGLVCEADEPIDPSMRRATRGVHLGEGAGALFLEWAPCGDGGVFVEDVRVGSAVLAAAAEPDRIESFATGERASIRRHADALARLATNGVLLAHPAARYGVFASLSAVAVAAEAARRLGERADPGRTLFVSVPRDAPAASVTLAGGAST